MKAAWRDVRPDSTTGPVIGRAASVSRERRNARSMSKQDPNGLEPTCHGRAAEPACSAPPGVSEKRDGSVRSSFPQWHIAVAAACAVLAGCAAPAPPAGPRVGEGSTRGGEEVRAVETTGRTGLRVLGLTQGRLRACSGSYPPPTLASPVRTTALACSGGVTGEATVRPDLFGGRTVTFELSTGERGRARL